MAEPKSKPRHREMRLHASLRIGTMLTATTKRRSEPVEVHLQQSAMDAACGIHVLAMALIILGLAKRSALVSVHKRKLGVVADLHRLLGASWMEGVFASEVVRALADLKLPLTVDWRDGFRGVDQFTVESLLAGHLVLIGHEEVESRYRHFTLGVGCTGLVIGKEMVVDTLLVIDPSLPMPPFAVGNSSMRTERAIDWKRQRASIQWWCEAVDHDGEAVRLTSAISLRLPAVG